MRLGGRESSWGANRRGALLAAAVLAFGGAAFVVRRELKSGPRDPGADVRRLVLAQADSLDASLSALSRVLAAVSSDPSTNEPPPAARYAFRHARAQYKHLEAAIEFYAPALAAAFNSRRQEVDDDDAPPPSFLTPSGFPALETVLWTDGGLTRSRADSARRIVAGMRPLVGQVRGLATGIQPTDAQVIEFTRLELVRIATLGIAGFDAPRSRDAMLESAEALDGVRQTYLVTGHRWLAATSHRRRLDAALTAAADYLRSHTDFASFDRLGFIVGQANAAAQALESLRVAEGTIPISMPRGLRAHAVSPYAAGAFDERAYAPRSAPKASPDLIALGQRLFTDPRLSGPGTRSCASCHNPSHAFTDGRPTPASLAPGLPVPRNTPTLINVGFQPAQFADERAVTLEDQVVEVLRSRAEMSSSIDSAAARLAADPGYREQFGRAFGDPGRGGSAVSVTPLRVRQAIAAFERSLVGMNSRFDQAVRGDTVAITRQERRGFNLFMGKAGCGSCHFAPLFGGTAPPDTSPRTWRSSAPPRRPDPRGLTRTPPEARSITARTTSALLRSRRFATWPSPHRTCTTAPF